METISVTISAMNYRQLSSEYGTSLSALVAEVSLKTQARMARTARPYVAQTSGSMPKIKARGLVPGQKSSFRPLLMDLLVNAPIPSASGSLLADKRTTTGSV